MQYLYNTDLRKKVIYPIYQSHVWLLLAYLNKNFIEVCSLARIRSSLHIFVLHILLHSLGLCEKKDEVWFSSITKAPIRTVKRHYKNAKLRLHMTVSWSRHSASQSSGVQNNIGVVVSDISWARISQNININLYAILHWCIYYVSSLATGLHNFVLQFVWDFIQLKLCKVDIILDASFIKHKINYY